MPLDAKFPRIPYWPWSPSIGRDDGVHPDPSRFVGEAVVASEKLDGGNTLLHAGEVYARSMTAPSAGKWMAMVKKHHAWKVNEPDVFLYGEDIYGVHSIEYEPVPEHETFYGGIGIQVARSRPLRRPKRTRGNAKSRSCRSCSRGVSGRLPRYARSWIAPTVSLRCSVVSGRALCCVWRAVTRRRSSRATSARASVAGTYRPKSIGPGTGGHAESRGLRDEAAARSG